MVSTDPISDMLTRIRNAIAVNKNEVSMPYSRVKESVAKVLADNNYLQSVSTDDSGTFKQLMITINNSDKNANITLIERVSKPGRRVYMGSDELPQVKQGRGMLIVSTSKGVMSGSKARKARLGGEVICKVY